MYNLNKAQQIDCVKMKYEIQRKYYEQKKNMSYEEEKEFIKNTIKNGSLSGFWKRLISNKKSMKGK